MFKRKIFKKKIINWKKMLFIFIFIFILVFFLFLSKNIKNEIFYFPQNTDSVFIVPVNKEGKEIPNQNKKSLHFTYVDNSAQITNKKNNALKFSIQIFTNQSYDIVNKKRIELLNSKNLIIFPEELSISIFNSTLGKEFFLLYKNFATRLKAQEFCNKYIFFLDKCLVVNVQNLD